MNKSHEEFMSDVGKRASLMGRIGKSILPESDEDQAMYANCEGGENGK